MRAVVYAFLSTLGTLFRSRISLQAEIVALRHQLAVYERSVQRPHIRPADRLLWSWLSRHWATWREALVFVQPETVIAWQRKRFRDHWTRMSRTGMPGRPPISSEIRELIRKVSGTNPLWGTPRIVGELGKLGINVAKSTVDKYRVRSRKTPSPTWKAFLKNHINELVSIDFFIVPTIRFKLLFVLIVLAHSRRKVLHFNVTENPTAQWTAQQIVEAFPGAARQSISFEIVMRSTVGHFKSGFTAWGSSRFSAHREARGRTRSWSGSSEPCDATASIMSSL
jgi:putative transposase